MAIPTKTVVGLSALVRAVNFLCAVIGDFSRVYADLLTPEELAALAALEAACMAMRALFPLGGTGANP